MTTLIEKVQVALGAVNGRRSAAASEAEGFFRLDFLAHR